MIPVTPPCFSSSDIWIFFSIYENICSFLYLIPYIILVIILTNKLTESKLHICAFLLQLACNYQKLSGFFNVKNSIQVWIFNINVDMHLIQYASKYLCYEEVCPSIKEIFCVKYAILIFFCKIVWILQVTMH